MKPTTQRVPVAKAAEELGLAIATVRYYLEIGKLPIGAVVAPPGAQRKNYLIYRDKLDAFLGVNKETGEDGIQKRF